LEINFVSNFIYSTYYQLVMFDELLKSPDFLFIVIPAKAGHVVKHQRYPAFSTIPGLPFSRE